jgi:hypothetical protein
MIFMRYLRNMCFPSIAAYGCRLFTCEAVSLAYVCNHRCFTRNQNGVKICIFFLSLALTVAVRERCVIHLEFWMLSCNCVDYEMLNFDRLFVQRLHLEWVLTSLMCALLYIILCQSQ